jgi:dihydroneopterin aldolase
MAIIRIHDLAADTIIGIYPHERESRQRIYISIELQTDIAAAAATDDFKKALDYEALANSARDLASESSFQLVESLAVAILSDIMQDARVESATVRLRKPDAIADAASVEIEVSDSRK